MLLKVLLKRLWIQLAVDKNWCALIAVQTCGSNKNNFLFSKGDKMAKNKGLKIIADSSKHPESLRILEDVPIWMKKEAKKPQT